MGDALQAQLVALVGEVKAAAIPGDSKHSAAWCVQQLPKLRDISDDIAVADHDPFWFSSGSACKKQNCFPVPAFLWNLQKTQEQTRRSQDGHDPPEDDLTLQPRHQLV